MNRCPSCNFPVDSEWRTCRRCGAHLAVPIERVSMPPAPARRTVPPAVHVPPPSDTLLPKTGSAPAGPTSAASPGADTMLPPPSRAHTAARRGIAAASVVALGVAIGRAVRQHRR